VSAARVLTAASTSSSTTAPIAAASTGLALIAIPKTCAGTRRSARRSARSGTADDSSPAAAAQASAVGVGGWAMSVTTPIGTYTSAESAPAAAEPSMPRTRRPTVRLSRMQLAQHAAASSPRPMPTRSVLG
jgi:hypothetical protein